MVNLIVTVGTIAGFIDIAVVVVITRHGSAGLIRWFTDSLDMAIVLSLSAPLYLTGIVRCYDRRRRRNTRCIASALDDARGVS